MSSPKLSLLALPLILAALLLITVWSHSKHKYYSQGEEIYVRVNSLTSPGNLLSLDRYSLPHCKHNEQVQKGMENLGHLLMGEKLHSSLYRFHVTTNASVFLCTSNPLSKQEVDTLRQSSIDMYRVNLVLDGLPALRFVRIGWRWYRFMGFSVGYTPDGANYYITNHLRFRILLHREKNVRLLGASPQFEIVGFEVIPCSVKHDSQVLSTLKMYDRISSISTYDSQPIREGERVTFTYEVEFAESDVKWSSRWKAYSESDRDQFHWFSFLNSLITTLFLAGFLLFKLSRTVWRDPSRRPLTDDALKAPSCSMLLCVMVGNGVQVFSMSFVTISIAALGIIPPASQGMLSIAFIAFHCLFGFVAGYVSVWLWRNSNGSLEGWRSVSWLASSLFNAVVFSIFTVLNSIHYLNGSTRAASAWVYAALVSLWLCISMPITFLGGYLASSQPGKANETRGLLVHADINQKTGANRSRLTLPTWLLIPLSGMVTFGTMLIELFYMWSSIWFGSFYGDYCFLILAAVLVVPSCATVSISISYKCVGVRDRNWWWKSFMASASSGFYAFLYAVKFMVIDLRGFNGPASAAIYLAYSLMLALGVALSTGAIGVLFGFAFVRYLAAK